MLLKKPQILSAILKNKIDATNSVMIARQYFIYLIAKGVPGLLNFLGLFLFTRLLSPEEYGNYILVMTVAVFMNAIVFQWLKLGILRYYPVYELKSEEFLSTLVTVYVVICSVLIFIGAIACIPFNRIEKCYLIIFGTLILCSRALFEANLEFHRIKLEAKNYGYLIITRSAIGLIIGIILVNYGLGGEGLLLGILVSYLIPTLILIVQRRSQYQLSKINKEILHKILYYGMPLSVTFLLEFIINGSDRLIIGWLINSSATGVYAAGYDLSLQTIGLLMSIVNLAAYPLAVRALEDGGYEKARSQLSTNGTLLFGISIPMMCALIMLNKNIVHIVLGPAFYHTGAMLMPWIAVSAFIAGVKAFHFDLSFQLGKKTIGQIWVVCISATVNLGLNIILIPAVGIIGAAYSTLIAYIIGLFLSWFLGKRIFEVPIAWNNLLKISISSIIMSLLLWPIANMQGVKALIIQIIVGLTSYLCVVFLSDVGGCKGKLMKSETA